MARRFATAIDLQQNELQRARLQNVVADPSGVEGQIIWRSDTNVLKIHDGSVWTTIPIGLITSAMILDGEIVNADINASAGIVRSKLNFGSGLVDADLATGAAIAWTKINSAGQVTATDIAAAIKGGPAAGVESLRALGSTATTAAAGNDSRLSDSRAPNGSAGGDLAGSYPNPTIGALKIDDSMVKAANKDGVVGLPSMRTLGTGSLQAAAGNDARFSDSRAPSGSAGGDLTGTYPNPTILPGVITDSDVNAANKDGVAGTASLRTLGTGAQQAAGGTHTLASHPAPIVALPMNGQKITGLADPTSAQDAATKAYVDATAVGLDVKPAVRVASTAGVTLPPGGTSLTIDGVALANGDRVLLKNQATASQNGLYIVSGIGSSVVLARSTDADTSAEVMSGMFVFVSEGTLSADTGWVLTTNNPITLATTSLAFAQFSGAGSFTDGAALLKSGNTLDVVVDNSTIEIVGDALRLKDAGITNAKVISIDAATKLTGAVPIANGGTGQITAPLSRTALTVPGRYDNAATHSSGTTITITAATHGLGTGRNKMIQVIEESSGDVVETDLNIAANGDVLVTFAVSQSANTHRVLIAGW